MAQLELNQEVDKARAENLDVPGDLTTSKLMTSFGLVQIFPQHIGSAFCQEMSKIIRTGHIQRLCDIVTTDHDAAGKKSGIVEDKYHIIGNAESTARCGSTCF